MKISSIKSFFPRSISNKQATDSGMALVLILLLIGFFSNENIYFIISIPILIINMTFPKLYYGFAIFWYGFSKLLGTVVSKIILAIVYFVFVFPVGLLRRSLGRDSLQLKKFKKDSTSAMKKREYMFLSKDIEVPY